MTSATAHLDSISALRMAMNGGKVGIEVEKLPYYTFFSKHCNNLDEPSTPEQIEQVKEIVRKNLQVFAQLQAEEKIRFWPDGMPQPEAGESMLRKLGFLGDKFTTFTNVIWPGSHLADEVRALTDKIQNLNVFAIYVHRNSSALFGTNPDSVRELQRATEGLNRLKDLYAGAVGKGSSDKEVEKFYTEQSVELLVAVTQRIQSDINQIDDDKIFLLFRIKLEAVRVQESDKNKQATPAAESLATYLDRLCPSQTYPHLLEVEKVSEVLFPRKPKCFLRAWIVCEGVPVAQGLTERKLLKYKLTDLYELFFKYETQCKPLIRERKLYATEKAVSESEKNALDRSLVRKYLGEYCAALETEKKRTTERRNYTILFAKAIISMVLGSGFLASGVKPLVLIGNLLTGHDGKELLDMIGKSDYLKKEEFALIASMIEELKNEWQDPHHGAKQLSVFVGEQDKLSGEAEEAVQLLAHYIETGVIKKKDEVKKA